MGDNSNITSPTYTQFDDSGKEELDNIFSTLNNKYMSKGIGVVIGEMGISYKNNNEAREQWASYYYGLSKKYTVPCVLWDNNAKNGSQKSENHWHLNRKNCKWGDPNVIQAIMNAMGVTNVSIPADDDVVEENSDHQRHKDLHQDLRRQSFRAKRKDRFGRRRAVTSPLTRKWSP